MINFATYVAFEIRVLQIVQKRSATFNFAWPTNSTPGILLHYCQKLGVVCEIFPLKGGNFLVGVFLIHSTSGTNCMWLAFMQFYRHIFN